MLYFSLSVLSVLSATLLVGPGAPLRVPTHRGDMIVKHKWDVVPDNWRSLGPPPDETTIELHIALQPNQKNALTDVLHEVSQPGHPKYGAHLSKGQVAELVAPHPDTLELVISWLEHNGVPTSSISTTHDGGWLTVSDVPISQANELLGASYRLYYHAGRNDTILRTIGYSLPAVLHVHVKTVIPTTAFTSTRLLQQTPPRGVGAPNVASGKSANTLSPRERGTMEPAILRSLYGTETWNPPRADVSRLGLVGYDDEYPSRKDLTEFLKRFRSDGNPDTLSFKVIDKEVPQGYESHRANMFLQYAVAMAFPIPVTFYNGTGARKYTETSDVVQQWLKYTAEEPNIPQTIALMTDGTKEENIPPDYAKALCGMFEVLGVRGVSVLVPSGDDGIGAGRCRRFSTKFPASCPYVTSVGGTMGNPEVASFFSGGGFSEYFPILNFQKVDVENYVGSSIPNDFQDRYNPVGRGVPDIALQSWEYAYIARHKRNDISSTVCATSTAAGIFSLINDFRLFHGDRPLGWLNPWLYGIGKLGFNDITAGHNQGCGESQGFKATDGWDPVTGLGSPNFPFLASLLGPILHPPGRRNESSDGQP